MFITFGTDDEVFLLPAAAATVSTSRKTHHATVHNHLTGQTHICVGPVAYHEAIASAVKDANQIADDTDQEAFVTLQLL